MQPQYGGSLGITQPWPPGGQQPPPGRRRFSWTALAALIVAVAALVIGIISLARPAAPPTVAVPSSSVAPSPDPEATTSADRALCTAIAPLMAEDDRSSNAFIDSGPAGSPERDAAQPKYRSDTEDWADRIQMVLDDHSAADPFFRRTLQRFIDDRILLVRNMRPGPAKPYDTEIWSDSMSAYGGPQSVCNELGIKW